MTGITTHFIDESRSYLHKLIESFDDSQLQSIQLLADSLLDVWKSGNQVFICGNGGSAANAIHMANDFHYGIGACGEGSHIPGIKVEALPANIGIVTCLANDTGYENIYSNQLNVKGRPGDILIVLSGSGNSANVVNAIRTATSLEIKSFAILAFDGGICKDIAEHVIHFAVNDMQIAEDTQLIIGHICMQWLNKQKSQITD